MKTILCNLFGHWWKYFFTQSDSHSRRTDIRVCKCCGYAQHYKQIFSFNKPSGEYVWMNMIGYTKKGAKEYHGKIFKYGLFRKTN